MKVSRVIVAPFLALTLIAGTAACSEPRQELRTCTVYEDEVLDLDDEGECYAPNDDKSKKKSVKKKSTKKKSGFGGTSKSSTRKK